MRFSPQNFCNGFLFWYHQTKFIRIDLPIDLSSSSLLQILNSKVQILDIKFKHLRSVLKFSALKTKLFLKKIVKVVRKIVRKIVRFGTFLLRNFRSLICKLCSKIQPCVLNIARNFSRNELYKRRLTEDDLFLNYYS